MAASCISVSLSCVGALVAAKPVEASGARQLARLNLAAPFVGSSSSCALDAAPASSFFFLASRAVRKVDIVARAAAELEEAPAAVSFAAAPAASTKLYVGNLPWSTQSKDLAEVFQDIGNVELVEVIYDRDTQRSRGFAFVTMSTVEEAERAIQMLDGSELEGRPIRVSFPQARERSTERGERAPRRERDFSPKTPDSKNKVFVGNLSWGVDDGALDELFSPHGTIQEARVVTDRDTGRSRGFGFVTYVKQDEALQAIEAMNGAEFEGRTLRVNPAGEKPERRDGGRY